MTHLCIAPCGTRTLAQRCQQVPPRPTPTELLAGEAKTMIADAFSPVQVLEQGAQQAKGEQARMVRGPARPRCRGRRLWCTRGL